MGGGNGSSSNANTNPVNVASDKSNGGLHEDTEGQHLVGPLLLRQRDHPGFRNNHIGDLDQDG